MGSSDVVVVGAGPAGSATAARLARAGLSVTLVDKSVFPRDKVCGDFVSPRGLRELTRLDCLDAFEGGGYTRIRETEAYLDGEHLLTAALPAMPGMPSFGHAIPRLTLDDVLLQQAAARGANVIDGARSAGIEYERDRVVVTVERGGKRTRLAGRVIVGADGATSTVAKAVGVRNDDPRHVLAALRGYADAVPTTRNVLYFSEAFFPGFAWLFPMDGGRANVGVGMVKEPLTKYRLSLRDFLGRFVGFLRTRLGRGIELRDVAGFPIKAFGGAGSGVFERGVLVGEAASFVDPMSGEGIPQALESGEMAAETIAEALASGGPTVDRLASYERRWRRRWEADLALNDLVVSACRNRHLLPLWMTSIRSMARAARARPDYAHRAGGILAGLVPARDALSARHVGQTLLGALGTLVDSLPGGRVGPTTLAVGALAVAGIERDVLRDLLEDRAWFGRWLVEIQVKQARVARALVAAPGGRGLEPPFAKRSQGDGQLGA